MKLFLHVAFSGFNVRPYILATVDYEEIEAEPLAWGGVMHTQHVISPRYHRRLCLNKQMPVCQSYSVSLPRASTVLCGDVHSTAAHTGYKPIAGVFVTKCPVCLCFLWCLDSVNLFTP